MKRIKRLFALTKDFFENAKDFFANPKCPYCGGKPCDCFLDTRMEAWVYKCSRCGKYWL